MGGVETYKNVRNFVGYALTFWKSTSRVKGLRLTLRGASKAVRFALFTDYEHEDARLCQRYLLPQDKVLELGSAIGFISLHCLNNIGVAAFAMVEANPNLLSIIDENYRLNGMAKPVLLNVAAGSEDGEAVFNISADYYASSRRFAHNLAEEVRVPQLTIPSIIQQIGFTPNALIIDIEGGEIDIPVAHYALFDKIIIELHGRFIGTAPIDRLLAGLADHGFEVAARDGYSCALLRDGAAASV